MENLNYWFELLVEVFKVIGIAIPLIIVLVKYVKIAVKERNWRQLIKDVMKLIGEAEEYTNLSGEGKKQFVIESVKEMAHTINYEISDEELSTLIDSIVALTNKVNVDKIKIQ